MEQDKKGNYRSESVFSRKIKAGKRRTYFFDVKSTKANDYFLTITESKKRPDETYERYKIFLYKEDFNKFIETLSETIDHIKQELMPGFDFDAYARRPEGGETGMESGTESRMQIAAEPEPEPLRSPEPKPYPDNNNQPKGDIQVNEDDLKW